MPFTDGLEVLRLKGASSARITDVSLIGSHRIALLGAVLLPPGRQLGAVQVVDSWPPEDREIDESALVEARGARIDDDPAGWELLLGLKLTNGRAADRFGVRIEYETHGATHLAVLPAFLRICASTPPRASAACDPPSDWLERQRAHLDVGD